MSTLRLRVFVLVWAFVFASASALVVPDDSVAPPSFRADAVLERRQALQRAQDIQRLVPPLLPRTESSRRAPSSDFEFGLTGGFQATTHENGNFDRISVNGSSSLTLRNCTVGTLIIHDSTADLDLLVADSTIGQVESTSQFLGNATFIECDVGGNTTATAFAFQTGTGPQSTLSIHRTNVTATTRGLSVGDAHGIVRLSDSRFTADGSGSSYGVVFSGYVFNTVQLIRCDVRASTTARGGATSVFFQHIRSGVHIQDTNIEVYSHTGSAGVAAGLYLHTVATLGCVYVSGGSVTAHCSATTAGTMYSVLMAHFLGGAVTFTNGTIVTANGFAASYGFIIQVMSSNSDLLLRSVTVVALSQNRKRTLTARAFFLDDPADNATTVLESTTLQAPQGACLYFSSSSPVPHGLVDMRGLTLAECYRNLVDTSSASSVVIDQNCVTLPGNHRTDKPIGYPPATTVFPCVNDVPRTTPIVTDIAAQVSLQTCTAFGSVTPFSTDPSREVALPSGRYTGATFGVVSVNNAASVTLVNCTIETLVIKDSASSLHLLAVSSTIGSVLSVTTLLGNATFVDCHIGGRLISVALAFPIGTGPHSILSVVNSSFTASYEGMTFGNVFGECSFVDSNVIVKGSLPTYGINFAAITYGPVSFSGCIVDATSGSTVGTTAIYFDKVRGGVHLVDCDLTAYSDTGREGNAAAFQVAWTETKGCVYVSGGTFLASCSSTTFSNGYAALMRSISRGTVTFTDNVVLHSIGYTQSMALYVQYLEPQGILLVRKTKMIVSSLAKNYPHAGIGLYIDSTYDGGVALLDSTVIQAPNATCLQFSTYTGKRSGLIDLRGLDIRCWRNLYDPRSTSSVSFHQNCLTIDEQSTDAPVAYSPATTVYPCVNNTPRTTPIETNAVTAGSCSTFGSIAPFRITTTTTLRGNVTRSDEYLGVLTIEDPDIVSLVNVEALMIRFTSSGTRPSEARIAITRSRISDGGVQLAAAFPNMTFVMEDTTIAARDPESTNPLLIVQSMRGGSFTVQGSTIIGQRMVYNPSTARSSTPSVIGNATLVFQDTHFVSERCVECPSDRHIAFDGPLVQSSVVFDGCIFRSNGGTASFSANLFRFEHLEETNVTINGLQASLVRRRSPSLFLGTGRFHDSCVTISNSTITQSCSQGTSSSDACARSGRSYFFSASKAPTGSSYLTLDNVSITMATYSATTVFMPYLQNIDVVMSKVSAQLNPRAGTSYFFAAENAANAVVAVLQSVVLMSPRGDVFSFRGVINASLLTVRSNFTAMQIMSDGFPPTLNARQGCNRVVVTRADQNDADFGATTDDCIETGPSMCAMTPAVYHALGINADKSKIKTPLPDPAEKDIKVWIIVGVVGGWVVIGCVGFAAFMIIRRRGRGEEHHINGIDGESGDGDSDADEIYGDRYGAEIEGGEDGEELGEFKTVADKHAAMFHFQLSNNMRVNEWLRHVDPNPKPIDLSTPAARKEKEEDHEDDEGAEEEDQEEEVKEDPRSVAMTVERFPASCAGSRVFGLSSYWSESQKSASAPEERHVAVGHVDTNGTGAES